MLEPGIKGGFVKMFVTFCSATCISSREVVMDINPKIDFNANRVASAGFTDAQGGVAAKSDQLEAGWMSGPALVVTEREPTGLESLDEHADADLRKDDPLGRLVLSAFDFKAPEVPEFI